MFKPVTFEPEVEELVHFVETTPREEIIEATHAKLAAGVSPEDLVRAGALAVVRSTELPMGHHGGPIHPICGAHAVGQMAKRLRRPWADLAVVQFVTLCNKHVHSPEQGPYIMAEMAPADSNDIFIFREKKLVSEEGGVEVTKETFRRSMRMAYPPAAEATMLYLLENGVTAGEVLDIVLDLAVPKNPSDDHFFLFPMYTWRALDQIGWEYAPVLLRPAIRYESRGGATPKFEPIAALLDTYKLLDRDIPMMTTTAETEAIGELADRIGASTELSDIPEMLAQALAGGMSLEGVGEALSIGAAVIHLRTSYGNPMDTHLQTGINTRRYLLGIEGVSLRNKILALLTWHTGPEISSSLGKFDYDPREDVAALPPRSEAELLEAITESIESQPHVEDLSVMKLPHLVAAPPGAGDARPHPAVSRFGLRRDGALRPPRRDHRPRRLQRDARLQAPPGHGRGIHQYPRAVPVGPAHVGGEDRGDRPRQAPRELPAGQRAHRRLALEARRRRFSASRGRRASGPLHRRSRCRRR